MATTLTLFSGLQDAIRAILSVVRGEQNNVGQLTLAPSAALTVVSFVNCAPGKTIVLQPCTANAAAALATTFIAPADIKMGFFTVRHANNAQVDRTFNFEVTGGG